MEDKSDINKNDDVMMPGFRFHPTDEELVGFYLKRKIQQKSLPIELIKQVDIYKYDPWDLPKLASSGEKEWYFYCPRDRKYRNSARPNRVTGAGFWKATGTDRPIYSSDGTKCIGLKKSLVFYRGRAAKGIKTDWMMHEFRLPSLGDPSPPKKFLDKSLPPNDAWAICRIFKKNNSMAQRALTHSWISSLPDTPIPSDLFSQTAHCSQFSSENISCTTEIGSIFQMCSNSDLHQASTASFSTSDTHTYKPVNPAAVYKPSLLPVSSVEIPNNFIFSPSGISSGSGKCTVDDSTMLLNSALLGDMSKSPDPIDVFNTGFSISLSQDILGSMALEQENTASLRNLRSMGFPFSLPGNIPEAWKSSLPWDSPPCPSEMSTSYSGNKCYT